MKPASDHQVDDQMEVALEAHDDSLADPTHLGHSSAMGGGQGWVDRSKEKWRSDPDFLQGLTNGPFGEGLAIGGDVG